MFHEFMNECSEISEATSYLEILNYSVSASPQLTNALLS